MQSAAQTKKGTEPVKFVLNKAVSRFSVQAFATGMLSAFGHNPKIEIRDYDAQIQFDPATYQNASVRVVIQTTKMEVLDEMKKDDRLKLEQEMYQKVLDVDHFPTAVYESKRVTVQKITDDSLLVTANGDLSFHGNTHSLLVQANVLVQGTMLRINGSFSMLQSDFGIKPVSFAAGALRLKDELKFTFDLVARQQD
jgi:polyisoprenoid-binding protein YceI